MNVSVNLRRPLFLLLCTTLLLLGVASFSNGAQADQPIPMIRTLCMPEWGIEHFSAHVETFNELATYINRRSSELETKLETLKHYGLLLPDEFSYTCDLPGISYKIYGHRPPLRERGMCGGDPRITISLERNGIALLDKVFFEPACYKPARPYVVSFSVDEVPKGRGARIHLVLSDGVNENTLHFTTANPSLNQAQLNCLRKEGYFNVKTNPLAPKTCISPATDLKQRE